MQKITRNVAKSSCCLLFILLSICLKAQPTANFSSSSTSGCTPLIVKFTDSSTGNPTTWKWDLGNNTTSILQNPSAIYFNPGEYTIKLVVANSFGIDSIVKIQYIKVYALPVVKFSAPITSGCIGLPVNFKDSSNSASGTINLWQWDFGDGYASANQNPVHTYLDSGNFNITLRVKNDNQCVNTISKTAYIKVLPAVKANFINSPPNNCNLPVLINFTNTSTGTSPLTFQWVFGDGGISSQQNPSHTYTTLGNYTVQLIITNIYGCSDTITKVNNIIIESVKANFSNPPSVCVQYPISLNNLSTSSPISNTWSFGDGSTSTETSPLKTYPLAGNYLIKLVSNFGACSDSITKKITINAKPAAAFSVNRQVSCNIPATINFTNNTVYAIGYQWDFGDGSFSALKNPVHTYTSFGTFTVQLIATNSNGCSDTLQKINLIQVQAPIISINNLPDRGCIPFTKKFISNIISVDSIKSFLWNFGDGNTSQIAAPTHIYTDTGKYTVTLITITAGGCSDTTVIVNGITTTIKPIANFYASPTTTCANFQVNFFDSSTGGITNWAWLFGDGGSSTIKNPIHTYTDTGKFTVRLIVWNNGCNDTVIFKNLIYINPPVARFFISLNCSSLFQRSFTDKSLGADSWNWDFGDGSTDTVQNPVHNYSSTGTYPIILKVKNNTTGCISTLDNSVQVINPKADFYAKKNNVCKGDTVNFISTQNFAEVTNLYWNFGDSIVETNSFNSTTHVYKTAGIYPVGLIIKTIQGCFDTLLKPAYLQINGPIANFTPNTTTGCLQNAVIFNNLSTSDGKHPIKKYLWDYGDGETDSLSAVPFMHIFKIPNSYFVKLILTDSVGCIDSFTMASPLIISQPIASFFSADTISCPNNTVNFTNNSSGSNLTYLWKFGNGTSSTEQNPMITFNSEGNFSVSLYITDQYGCTNFSTKLNYISIIKAYANFNLSDSTSNCPPLIIQLTDLSSNAITKNWDFGDGTVSTADNPSHFYTYPGNYIVTLSITSPGGCAYLKQKTVFIKGPTGTFQFNPAMACNPATINFVAVTQNIKAVLWDFNDGSTIMANDSISHQYIFAGTFLPKIILIDKDDCKVPIKGIETITVNGVKAQFKFNSYTLCDSGNIVYDNISYSNDIIAEYSWLFGDGTIGSNINPQHHYSKQGIFYPKLIVTTKHGCKDSLLSTVPVKVVASPNINISNTSNGCVPLTVNFKGNITATDSSIISWAWNFGLGNGDTLKYPSPKVFSIAGMYPIVLTATNSSGCSGTAATNIEAFAIPNISAGTNTFICQSKGIFLQATGAVSYSWHPALGLSCTTCANPFATPDSTITYTITGTSEHNCVAEGKINVLVKFPFKLKYSKTDTLCTGQRLQLYASGADIYSWLPLTAITNANTATPTASPITSTSYTVIGWDDKNCFSDTGFVFIKVYPIPVVNAGADKTINIGQTYDIKPSISADVTSVLWTPATGRINSLYPGITVKPGSNTNYTIEAKNEGGCLASDQINIIVVCNGANVFIPNTFSPNGDGANDIFYPRGTGLFKIQTLRIFNRWGEVVFEKNSFNANDPAAGWNGNFKGVKLAPDVYVYTIDIICDNNSILNYKGDIALLL